VVLSACETGKVDPNNTNGERGLTKAFIQAGEKVGRNNKRQYANTLKQSK
jgi:hypothetical protein